MEIVVEATKGGDVKQSAVTLVRNYFGASMAEMKALTGQDRQQVASAIAREQGLTPDQVNFELVAY